MKALRAKQEFSIHIGYNYNSGFTYIGLLLFIAITGIGLSVVGISWQYQVRTDKEKQLLFVGAEFKNAINSYYASTPDAAKVYPANLNDLLLDKRMPIIKRHLRKIYLDPMTGKADWGVVTQQGSIVGIYSKSTLTPFKKKGANSAEANLAGAKSYKDWLFVGNGGAVQKVMVNSASLSNSVPVSAIQTSGATQSSNSKKDVSQEVLDRQNTLSNSGTEVSQEENSTSLLNNKPGRMRKYGDYPGHDY